MKKCVKWLVATRVLLLIVALFVALAVKATKTTVADPLEQVKALLPKLQEANKSGGKKLTAVIANMQYKDEDRQHYKEELHDPLLQAFESCNIDAEYVDNPTIEFFYDNSSDSKDKHIYDYDIILLQTHGSFLVLEYSKEHEKESTYFGFDKWGEYDKCHLIATSDDIELIKNARAEFDEDQPKWEDYYQKFSEWRENKGLKDVSEHYLNFGFENEKRNGEWYWVAHPVLTEFFFSDVATGRFHDNSILFNTACESLKGETKDQPSYSFADVLLNKNLRTYIGYTETNHYGCATLPNYLSNCLDLGWSLGRVLEDMPAYMREETAENVRLKPGFDPSKDKFDDAKLLIYPENDEERFLLPTCTNQAIQKEIIEEYFNNKTVTISGTATFLKPNAVSKGFKVGLDKDNFSYDFRDNTTNIPVKEIENVGNGNYSFSTKLSNLELGKTYYYRAYTHDGLYPNYGDICSLIIPTLSANNLSLEEGESREVKILAGNGNYTATSNHPEFATASIQGNIVTVNGLTAGDAEILIKDTDGFSATIKVKVKVPQKSFTLGITELEMPAGEVRSISIRRGSGDFTVTNHNPDIATGMIFESVYMPYYLEVEAFKPGTALIDVKDQESGDVIQLSVTVTEGSGNPDVPHNSIISFVDPKVKEICVQNWDTDGDGELSYEEAAAVKRIPHGKFSDNWEITSFDELQYFTGLTEIWSSTFDNCYFLKSVTIPNTVNEIGNGAFSSCESLTSITIPNSVTTIDGYAFQACRSLTSISIPESVTSIGNDAFSFSGWYNEQPDGLLYLDNWLLGYKGEKPEGKLVIREGTKAIAREAFKGCSGLTSIITPNSMTAILYNAFKDCNNITSVTVGKSMTYISAFDNCNNLTSVIYHCEKVDDWFSRNPIKSVVLGDEVKIIGNRAFYNYSSLISITIPNSVSDIESYAFWGCSSLRSITIPNSVKHIGEWAFSGCSSLTSFIIPNSVTEIGTCAFQGCNSLTSVYIPNAEITIGYNAFWKCDNLASVTFHCKEIKDWFAGKKSIKEVIMGDEVITIGSDAFGGCIGLNTITIPNSVTTIGSGAFSGCSNLTSVTISSSVVTIDSGAFQGCVGLTTITIPNSVTSIDGLAFQGCSGLTSVTIGKSVNNIDYDAFYDCNALRTITFHCKEIGNCFEGMESIKEIIIGDEVTSIGRYAFRGCTGLTDVTIGKSVTTIDYCAFEGCSNLLSIIIPNSVVAIEGEAFKNCNSLTSITIPNSVTSISFSVFSGCSGLVSATIGNSVKNFDNGVFDNCNALKSLTIHCREIGSWFQAIESIDEVVIGNGVTSIGIAAFRGCKGLTTITIGNSVASIEDQAFGGCYSLQKFVSHIKEPFEIPMDVFYGLPDDATLYVPAGTKAKYEVTKCWNKFKNIVEMEEPVVKEGDLNDDDEIDVTDVVELIDMVLAGTYKVAADINGDGEVDVTDVVELIDMVLAGE